MRIAFTGSGGTGKTTLAKHISEKWGIPYVGSLSREVMREMGIESEYAQNDMPDTALFGFQSTLLARRREKLAGLPSFVTDRLELDQYVYALRRCGSALSDAQRLQWLDEAVAELWGMDLVFHTPSGLFPVPFDGVRQADAAHQSLIDTSIYGLLCKHAFDRMAGHVYVVNMSDLDRRKSFVDALCSELRMMEPT